MRGFTLVELLVTSLIVVFMIGAILVVLDRGTDTYYTEVGLLDLRQQTRQAMDGMIRELRQTNENSGEGNINIPSNSVVTFSIPSETYGSNWIGPITYSLDEVENQIIREYPAGTNKILANDITSLNFSLNNDILGIQLTAAETVQGRDLSLTLKETVRLRNEY